jgi:RNA polymerase sigma-70 factor (ECF subfamily)
VSSRDRLARGQKLIQREQVLAPETTSIRLRKEVERWFFELRDPTFRYLRTLGCPHSVTEEITQEAFLRLHGGLRDGPRVRDVRAWVFRVARNLWIDHQRERQRYSTSAQDEGASADVAQSDSGTDPEQRLLERERMLLIESEVRRLPELQRACLRLKAQGLRYHQIAAALGISMTRAVYCVRRAVKRIQRRFTG